MIPPGLSRESIVPIVYGWMCWYDWCVYVNMFIAYLDAAVRSVFIDCSVRSHVVGPKFVRPTSVVRPTHVVRRSSSRDFATLSKQYNYNSIQLWGRNVSLMNR